jgi:hypothetical protein
VNIVRLHGSIVPKSPDSAITDVDEQELDEIYRLVAAMKKSGIYTVISPYWGVHVHAQKNWGVADAGNGNCTALLFFDPVVQKGYKAWLKRIYADANPYTGIPLAKDPAVAMIQIQNEDSMLFWTMQSVQGQQLLNLRRIRSVAGEEVRFFRQGPGSMGRLSLIPTTISPINDPECLSFGNSRRPLGTGRAGSRDGN